MDCVSVYDLLLPFGMTKPSIKKWIIKEYLIFQWYWSINILQCILDSLSFFIFVTFTYKTSNVVYMFEIFHFERNVSLKASLAIIHMTTFILLSSFFFHFSLQPIICGEVYFQHKWNLSLSHTYTYIHLSTFLGNRKWKRL